MFQGYKNLLPTALFSVWLITVIFLLTSLFYNEILNIFFTFLLKDCWLSNAAIPPEAVVLMAPARFAK